jgi:hypothetical protein
MVASLGVELRVRQLEASYLSSGAAVRSATASEDISREYGS